MGNRKNGYIYCHALDESGSAILTLAVLKKGAHTALECGIIDPKSKEKLECIEYIFGKSGVKKDLFGCEKIEAATKNGSFSVAFCGDEKHINIRFEKCLAHTELTAEIVLKPLSPVISPDKEEKTGFFTVQGKVFVKDREYTFSYEKSVGIFRSSKAFLGKSRYGAGFVYIDRKLLALVSDFENEDRNRVFYDGVLYETGGFSLKKGESFGEEWILTSQKCDMKISFFPKFNDRIDVSRPWLRLHGDRVFGTASGSIASKDGKRLSFDGMHCLYERID